MKERRQNLKFKGILRPYCCAINLIAGVSCRINDRARDILFNVPVLILSFMCILKFCNDRLQEMAHYDTDIVRIISPVLFLLILISCTEDRVDIEKMKPNAFFWTGWLVCFVSIFALSFVHPVKKMYLLWSVLSLTILPMIMIAMSCSRSRRRWLGMLAWDMVGLSYVFLFMNLAVTSMTTKEEIWIEEFLGICSNSNANGLICAAFFSSALYLLLTENKYRFFSLLSAGISITIAFISASRAAQLAMVTETAFAVILYFVHNREHKIEGDQRRIALAIIAAVLLSLITGWGLLKLDRMDINAYGATDYEEATQWVEDSEIRSKINSLTSDRLMLWKAYSTKLNFWGNGKTGGPLMPEDPASKWPHNNAIEIWYTSGFIAFLGYVTWLLAGIVFVLKCLFGKGWYRSEYLFTALTFIGYFIFAMLEITLYPMTTGIFFLLCMTMGNIAFEDGDKYGINNHTCL